jgi:hypothetical protein
VRVHEGEGGAMVAAVELPHSVAITRAEYETEGDVARYVDMERMRIAERLELFLSAPGAQVCAVSVVWTAFQMLIFGSVTLFSKS